MAMLFNLSALRRLALALSISVLGPVYGCQAAEQPVRIGVGQALAPFAIADTDAGLLVDIVRAAFEESGRPTQFFYWPNARIPLELSNKGLDVSTLSKKGDTPGITYSHWPVLTLLNAAITVKSRNLPIHSIKDMRRYRVVSFQDAHKFLGAEFAEMAASNKNYLEHSRMPISLLFENRVDVMVTQPDIFRFKLHQEQSLGKNRPEVSYHPVFAGGNQYWFGFQSVALRDQFEAGIAALYANGKINTIFARYHQRYGTSRDAFRSLDCHFLKVQKPKTCA